MSTTQRPFTGTTVRRDLMVIEGQRTTREIPRCEALHPSIEGVKCRRHIDHLAEGAIEHTAATEDYSASIRWH